MQADTLVDERIKVLYALSFLCGGMAQVWAANETMVVINRKSQMQTLDIFLENIKRTFGDMDRVCMVCTQLHDLKMTPSITAEDYIAQFKMLMGWTIFNDKALKDAYIRSLPNLILQMVFTQVTLPKGLDTWKMVIQNLDHPH